ncbi:MAG TPA: hypothetical protein VFR43_02910 [Gaiellaceae bacterium]|nr:hypothetical protein [Gaiellaceae bacterium]
MTFLGLPWFVLTTSGSPAKMGWVLAAELALGAGVVMEATDVRLLLALAAAGLTVSGLLFAAIALAHAGRAVPPPEVAAERA